MVVMGDGGGHGSAGVWGAGRDVGPRRVGVHLGERKSQIINGSIRGIQAVLFLGFRSTQKTCMVKTHRFVRYGTKTKSLKKSQLCQVCARCVPAACQLRGTMLTHELTH